MWNSGSGAKTVSTAERREAVGDEAAEAEEVLVGLGAELRRAGGAGGVHVPGEVERRPVETGHGVQRLGPDGPAASSDLPVDGIGQVEHGRGRPGPGPGGRRWPRRRPRGRRAWRRRARPGRRGSPGRPRRRPAGAPATTPGTHPSSRPARRPGCPDRPRPRAGRRRPSGREPRPRRGARLRRAVGSGRPHADRPEAGVGTASGAVEDQLGQVPHASPSYESERSTRRAT